MNYSITLIGSVGGTSFYSEADILRLLETEQTQLLHGETFTGRPGTQIYIESDTVLKIRSDIRLAPSSAKRWAIQALNKEKNYQVYHPDKTWFVAEDASDSIALIGNICPRLQPLHDLLAQSTADHHQFLHYFMQLFDHYFRLAQTMNLRLDEGLSNFGINTEHQLYYLDDDIYSWDRFVSCAQMLGVYFRSLPWLKKEIAVGLGQTVHELILKHFDDSQYFVVLAEQLKDVYLPTEEQQQAVLGFINHLIDRQPLRSTPIHFNQHRYLAILADIHANLPALDVVLNFLKLQNIQQGIVLGDIVGYGPYPSECIARLQETNFTILKGNHDHGLAGHHFKKGFSSTASWVLEWSLAHVNVEQKNWLADLPPLWHDEHWLAVHGAPIDPTFFNAYVYEMTYTDNLDVLQRKKIPLCFHGHTHQPCVYGRKGVMDSCLSEAVVDLNPFHYALVCPGSVGQPRNGQVGTQFAIYDQKEHKVYYHQLQYNLDAILTKMEIEAFPQTLISILKGFSQSQ